MVCDMTVKKEPEQIFRIQEGKNSWKEGNRGRTSVLRAPEDMGNSEA